MTRFSLILFGFTFLIACGQRHEGEKKTGLLSHFVSITDNEDKGVKEILNFYGGECKYSIGTAASTNNGYTQCEVKWVAVFSVINYICSRLIDQCF